MYKDNKNYNDDDNDDDYVDNDDNSFYLYDKYVAE